MTRRKGPPPTLRVEQGQAVRFRVNKLTMISDERRRQRMVLAGTVGVVERSELNGTVLLVAVAVANDGMADAVVAGSSEVEILKEES